MKRYASCIVLAMIVAAAAAVSVAAAPIPGASYGTETFDSRTLIDPGGLCADFPRFAGGGPNGTEPITRTHVEIFGWYGPTQYTPGVLQEVQLQANASGEITDLAGNTYHLTGHFQQRGDRRPYFPYNDIHFDGEGSLTISGPAGTFAGKAEMGVLTGAPTIIGFLFTRFDVCKAR